MKGAGKGGTDIGASVLYRFQNGVLTNQPLWDPVTGAFPWWRNCAGGQRCRRFFSIVCAQAAER